MNAIVKAFFVWLMLLAVPFQGFAAASAVLCAPLPVASVQDMAKPATDQHGTVAAGGEKASAAAHPHHHADGKCGACANCCTGAAITPSFVPALPVHPARLVSTPMAAHRLVSVDLALPERPPRA
ncbi:hypothetical protein NX774_00025 [Massilia agilis]|uniref:DUF2946 domain-containing protein n=1 Tax=Massilia agilis TaxID=1811226 RepID=A0ABT2D4T2_9BURK|nr:hypothetical protein [Massilia agilis]MCS0806311.1 hypothetical protein [Massilia agilis]